MVAKKKKVKAQAESLDIRITNRIAELKKGLVAVQNDINMAKQAESSAVTRGVEMQGAIKELEELLKG